MKHLLSILLTAALCATASAQTIRTLGFNTTNGQVVANTGTNVLTFTNNIAIHSILINNMAIWGFGNSVDFDQGILSGSWEFNNAVGFGTPLNQAATRANLGFSTDLNTLWTATNASNARSAVGLGATNDPRFAALRIGDTNISFESTIEDEGINWYFNRGTNASEPAITIGYQSNSILSFLPIVFQSNSHTATTRTNLGLGLPALTNTSNVAMVRALAGTTNTNAPVSGSVELSDGVLSWLLTFSNGILVNLQEQ